MRIAAGHDALIALFEREGYARVEPPVLQPADVFVDLSGEDIRRRMFVTQDAAGASCACGPSTPSRSAASTSQPRGAAPASYSYLGPVFRLRPARPASSCRPGSSSIGRRDAAAADAEILALALEGLARARRRRGRGAARRHGPARAPSSRRSRSRRRAKRRRHARHRLRPGPRRRSPSPPAAASASMPACSPRSRARRRRPRGPSSRTSSPSPASPASAGARPGEIARALPRPRRRTAPGIAAEEARRCSRRYLAISGDPDAAAARDARARPRGRARPRPGASTRFEERTGFMAARGLDVARLRVLGRPSRATSTTTRASSSRCRTARRADGKPSSAADATTGCCSISARPSRRRRSAARSGSTASPPESRA